MHLHRLLPHLCNMSGVASAWSNLARLHMAGRLAQPRNVPITWPFQEPSSFKALIKQVVRMLGIYGSAAAPPVSYRPGTRSYQYSMSGRLA